MPAIWKRLAVALALTALVLTVERQTYWRPFDDTAQESLASGHAFGFAAASIADLWPNPLVARYPQLNIGQVIPYPHWPNGFFLALEAFLRVFGRTEAAGRTFAILGNLAGFGLLLVSLRRADWLLFLTLPLLAISAIGRDALPFLFNDVGRCLALGALLFLGTRAPDPSGDRWFRLGLVAGVFMNHLLAPFAAAIALLRGLERRSWRVPLLDLAVLGAACLAVLGSFAAATAGGVGAGVAEVGRIYAYRSDRTLADCYRLLNLDVRLSLNLEPVSSHLVAVAWLIVVWARQWRVVLLLPSFLVFTVLLREYVVSHHFVRLPFVFFALITMAVAAEVVLERLPGLRTNRAARTAAQAALAVLLAVRLAGGTREYAPDPMIQLTRERVFRTVGREENRPWLARCGAYRFAGSPDQRRGTLAMAQLSLGPLVADRFRRGVPVEFCEIDLAAGTIRLADAPPAR